MKEVNPFSRILLTSFIIEHQKPELAIHNQFMNSQFWFLAYNISSSYIFFLNFSVSIDITYYVTI